MSFTEILIIIGQFFLSLSLLIILHELGHFIPAKLFKIRVEKFYLFFDVKFSLFKKKVGETVYGIGWLPLGGYVKIAGMIDESMDKEQMALPPEPWEFRSKPTWQRLIIMLGGVIVNFVLAWLIYVSMAFVWGDNYISTDELRDRMVVSDFLTEKIGLQSGDKIVAFDGEPIESFNQISSNLILSNNVEIIRDNQKINLPIKEDIISDLIDADVKNLVSVKIPFVVGKVPEDSHNINSDIKKGDVVVSINGNKLMYSDDVVEYLKTLEDGNASITVLRLGKEHKSEINIKDHIIGVKPGGITTEDLGRLGYYNLSIHKYNFGQSFAAGNKDFVETFKSFGKQLKKLANPSTGAYKGLGSFISIAKVFPTSWNWQAFWSITAFLSIMLGVVNLLPIPALDGGHAVFLIYEMIVGKKPSDKFLEYAQMVGLVILLSLFVFAFGNDIYRNFIK